MMIIIPDALNKNSFLKINQINNKINNDSIISSGKNDNSTRNNSNPNLNSINQSK